MELLFKKHIRAVKTLKSHWDIHLYIFIISTGVIVSPPPKFWFRLYVPRKGVAIRGDPTVHPHWSSLCPGCFVPPSRHCSIIVMLNSHSFKMPAMWMRTLNPSINVSYIPIDATWVGKNQEGLETKHSVAAHLLKSGTRGPWPSPTNTVFLRNTYKIQFHS